MINLPWAIVNDAHKPINFGFIWNSNTIRVKHDNRKRRTRKIDLSCCPSADKNQDDRIQLHTYMLRDFLAFAMKKILKEMRIQDKESPAGQSPYLV